MKNAYIIKIFLLFLHCIIFLLFIMAKKRIYIKESELKSLISTATKEILGNMLTEMPYERSDFFIFVDINPRNAYIHLAKILLYGNNTNDLNGWINEIVNKFTIPSLLGKVYVSNKARAKVIINGYINNFFDKNFQDYTTQMENFCAATINDIEGKAKKNGLQLPIHNEIKTAIENGKNLIVDYANSVSSLASGTTPAQANSLLQDTIRNGVDNIIQY